MKTITEFNGFSLKSALPKYSELVGANKTAEEILQAMGEEFKLEGDKLKFFLNSLEQVGAKPDRVKRVVVLAIAEGEKLPAGATQIDQHAYLPEYFPEPPQPKKPGRFGKHPGGKGPRGKGKKRGKGRGPRREGRPGAKPDAGTSPAKVVSDAGSTRVAPTS